MKRKLGSLVVFCASMILPLAACKKDGNKSPDEPSKEDVKISTCKEVYEVGAALESTKNTEEKYTVEGTVTYVAGNQYTVQDSTGGLLIYNNSSYTGTVPTLGDKVKVTSKIKNYNGTIETLDNDALWEKTGTGETITPKAYTSIDSMTVDTQNTLASLEGIKIKQIPSIATRNAFVTATLGDKDIDLKLDSYGPNFDYLKTQFTSKIPVGATLNVTKALIGWNKTKANLTLFGEGTLTNVQFTAATSIKFNDGTNDVTEQDVNVNETIELKDLVKVDESATSKDVVYSSSDEDIAKVDETGKVTGVSVGDAIITAASKYSPDVKATITIHVKKVDVSSIAISPSDPQTIGVGQNLQLTATVSPDNATNQEVTWESSDPTVASVSEDGVVTGVKADAAAVTITAKSKDDNTKTDTLSVTVSARTKFIKTEWLGEWEATKNGDATNTVTNIKIESGKITIGAAEITTLTIEDDAISFSWEETAGTSKNFKITADSTFTSGVKLKMTEDGDASDKSVYTLIRYNLIDSITPPDTITDQQVLDDTKITHTSTEAVKPVTITNASSTAQLCNKNKGVLQCFKIYNSAPKSSGTPIKGSITFTANTSIDKIVVYGCEASNKSSQWKINDIVQEFTIKNTTDGETALTNDKLNKELVYKFPTPIASNSSFDFEANEEPVLNPGTKNNNDHQLYFIKINVYQIG